MNITGIIPFTYFAGHQKPAGSTFLRADGLVANADDFEIWKHGYKYDNLIFQKVYWPEMMQHFAGPKILDLCDPDWFTGSVDIMEVGQLADAITCSSETLTQLVKSYFPDKLVEHVPDRLNFKIFPPQKAKHQNTAQTLVWFGFIRNAYETLAPLAPVIKKHGLQLTIISNEAYSEDDEVKALNPAFIQYHSSTAYHHIQNADIVLNPRSGRAFFKYKSNNKTLISYKLGLPVAETETDIERLLDADERNRDVAEHIADVQNNYNILSSAQQYRKIISQIKTSNA